MSNVLDFQVSGAFQSKVGGLGATVKYFPRPIGSSIGVAPSTPSATNATGSLFLPAQNVYNGQQMNLMASGTFGAESGDPSGTVTVEVKVVTGSLTSPTYTSIATTGAITPFFSVEPWALSLELIGASNNGANGLLLGNYQVIRRVGSPSVAAITNIISGLDFNAGNPSLAQGAVLGFVVGVTFGTSDATNTAALTQFTIET